MDFASKADLLGQRMRDDSISLKESLEELKTVDITDDELPSGLNRLVYNHCLSKTSVHEELFGLQFTKKTFLKKIDQAIEGGFVSEPIFHHRKHLFTRSHVSQIMEHFDFEKYSDKYNPFALAVCNYKGGTGKSTTAVTLSVASALDMDINARVCLLDLDPQGSAARGIINVDEDSEQYYITLADLQCYDLNDEDNEIKEHLDSGIKLEDLVIASAFNTHLPNLDVITAFPTDEKFSDYYMKSDENKQVDLLTRLRAEIMPILKSKYDIIIMDLPPQNSPIVWSALESADGVITPVSPKAYDYTSTESFLLTIGDIARNLPSKGKNIQYFKILPVNHKANEKHERNILDRLVRALRDDLMVTPISHSPLYLEAAALNRTIYDIKKSESNCSAKQFDEAVFSANKVYQNVICEIKQKSVKG